MGNLIVIILLAMAAGIIPALIAKNIGRSFLSWWVYGTALFVIALPHALYLTYRFGFTRCSYCRSMVRVGAANCPRCGANLDVYKG